MIVKPMFFAGLISISSLFLSTAVQFFLASKLGVEMYGVFSYGWTAAVILSSFLGFGLIQTSLQYIPKYSEEKNKSYLRGYIFVVERYLFWFVALFSILLSSTLLLLPVIPSILNGFHFMVFFSASLALTSVFSTITRCLDGSLLTVFFEKTSKELLMLFSLFVMFFFELAYTYEAILKLLLASSLVSMVSCYLLMKKRLNKLNIFLNDKKIYEFKNWFSSSSSFVLISIFYLLLMRVDFFILPIWWDAKELGEFSIAMRLTEFISFGLLSFHLATLPMIAKYYRNNNFKKMKKIVDMTILAGGLSGLLVVILLLLWGESILNLIDPSFSQAYGIILLMLAPQLLRAIDSTAGNLLNIIGSHKVLLRIAISTFIVKIILSLYLVKNYGAIGAAWSTSIALVFSILWQSWSLSKKLNFPIGLSGNLFYRLQRLN